MRVNFRSASCRAVALLVLFLGLTACSPPTRGLEEDREAVKWYRRVAEQGNASAQHLLGLMYVNGRGVPRDDREAVKWYRRAAEQGNARAQHLLGTMYTTGEGVPKDDREAVKWYRRSAEKGNAGAQFNLGVMYSNGEGVPKDDREAVKWFRRAAEKGDALRPKQPRLDVRQRRGRAGGRPRSGEVVPTSRRKARACRRMTSAPTPGTTLPRRKEAKPPSRTGTSSGGA